ncbi:MAG: hypothetical protein ACOYMN_05965, partial [Roseimicrobium sp.]
ILKLSSMHFYAWRKGLKTTYYLRTLSATDIEVSSVSQDKELRGVIAKSVASQSIEGNAAPKPASSSLAKAPSKEAIAEATAYWSAQKEKAMNDQECGGCS